MPIRLNLKRTHRYDVSSKGLFVVPIYTLDHLALEYTVSASTTGRDALEFVAQRLEIDDVSYFGFRYESWGGEYRWIFLNKSIKKQLDKHARQHTLIFGVMFFIENPQVIPRDVVRRQFFYQLRHEVATGSIVLTPKQAIKLCAYSLQADYGDFIDCQTTIERWRERPPISESCLRGAADLETVEHVEDILWGYRHLQGVTQVNAQWYYIDEVRRRDSYGVQLFYGGMKKNVVSELGVSRNGVTIADIIDSKASQHHHVLTLRWEEIKDLSYSKKTFSIQRLRKSKPINFSLGDKDNARYLWQYCIQIHGFYINYWTRLRTSPPQPTVHVPEPPDIIRGMSSVGLSQRANSSRSHTSDGSAGDSQPSLTGHRSLAGLEYSPLTLLPSSTSLSYHQQPSSSSQAITMIPLEQPQQHQFNSLQSTQLLPTSTTSDYLHTSSQLQLMHQQLARSSPLVAPSPSIPQQQQHTTPFAYQPPPLSSVYNPAVSRLSPLPPYRPAPDYDTAMRSFGAGSNNSSYSVVTPAALMPLYDNLQPVPQHPSRCTPPTHDTFGGLQPTSSHVVDNRRASTSSTVAAADQMARLLSNPDIHQLLALTNVQETELTHRLLAEYRHTLRQQQSIHTNSVSTPNLAARDIFEAAATLERPNRVGMNSCSSSAATAAAANQRGTRGFPGGSLLADPASIVAEVGGATTGSLLRGDGGGGRRRTARDRASGASSSADSNATFRVKCESLLLPGDEGVEGVDVGQEDFQNTAGQHPSSIVARKGVMPVSRSEQGPRWGLCPGSPSGGVLLPGDEGDAIVHQDEEDDDDDGSLHEYVLQQPEERPSHYTATHLSVLLAARQKQQQQQYEGYHHPSVSSTTASSVTSSGGSYGSQHYQKHHGGSNRMKVTPPASRSLANHKSRSHSDSGGSIMKRLSLTSQSQQHPISNSGVTLVTASDISNSSCGGTTNSSSNSSVGTGMGAVVGHSISHLLPAMSTHHSQGNTSMSLLELLKRPRVATCNVSKDEKRMELELALSEPGLLATQFHSIPSRSPTATCYVASSPENRARNRSEQVLPYDQARVKLEPTTENASGYINASHVKVDLERGGHRLQLWLITTQIPLPTTVADFWSMVWQCQVGVLALLAGERSSMPLYIPCEDVPVLHLRDMTVRFQWKKPCDRYIQTCVDIEHKTRGRCRPVYHFRYTDWTDANVPANVADFTEYLDDLTALNRHLTSQEHAPGSPPARGVTMDPSSTSAGPFASTGLSNRPLLLHCETGAGGSGLSALYLVMRAVLEHNLVAHSNLRVSDVLTSLRTSSCQSLVQNSDQYIFVHAALLHYLRRTRLI